MSKGGWLYSEVETHFHKVETTLISSINNTSMAAENNSKVQNLASTPLWKHKFPNYWVSTGHWLLPLFVHHYDLTYNISPPDRWEILSSKKFNYLEILETKDPEREWWELTKLLAGDAINSSFKWSLSSPTWYSFIGGAKWFLELCSNTQTSLNSPDFQIFASPKQKPSQMSIQNVMWTQYSQGCRNYGNEFLETLFEILALVIFRQYFRLQASITWNTYW